MSEHYIRLLTNVELNTSQKKVWYQVVKKFLSRIIETPPLNFLSDNQLLPAEFDGDIGFNNVYIIYLIEDVDSEVMEEIVKLWDEIYPLDFEIESSTEYGCGCDDCDVEIDDALHEEIQRRANKFLRNQKNSVTEEYLNEFKMNRKQAITFFKSHSYLFT